LGVVLFCELAKISEAPIRLGFWKKAIFSYTAPAHEKTTLNYKTKTEACIIANFSNG